LPETQASRAIPGILAEIVQGKRAEVEALRARRGELERAAANAPSPRDFHGALAGGASVSLIAECKRRSPGAGPIRPDVDPVALTRGYEAAGASALCVLTDARWFGGSLDDLRAVRAGVGIPSLRKDFTVDPLQVLEARAAGADAVLLIVRILEDSALREMLILAGELGMAALVETHDAAEIERALGVGASIVGINNRDLDTFTTDVDTTLRLLDGLPAGVTVISESGIRTAEDVRRLGAAGVDGILVGETLLRAPDPGAAAASFSSLPREERRA
jgi:indole-3-glycerol phosphate synthase